jgi:tRNA threonylcarbamoyladenosine biosynthesis protein TsaE
MIEFADETETCAFAAALAAVAVPGDVIGLTGPLGTGKTVFARAFIRALAAADIEVPSPTYTLMQLYETPLAPVYHFDFYRLESARELDELGLDDAFADGISLIEWPERCALPILPGRLDLVFSSPDAARPELRRLEIAPGAAWRARLAALLGNWEARHGRA